MTTIQSLGPLQSTHRPVSESTPEATSRGGGPQMPDAAFYGLGIEFVAAQLASKAAEATSRIARQVVRAEKLQQAAEQRAQSDAIRDKAGEQLHQAIASSSFSVVGGMLSFGSALSMAPATANSAAMETPKSKALGATGSTVSALSQPAGTMFGGARATELDATAADHGANAKTAEGIADEVTSLERQAKSIVEKATAAMQSFLQERQAISRAILQKM